MADAVTTQTIQDGPRNAIMKFTNVSDSTGEAAVVKVDVSALTVQPRTGAACTSVAVAGIQFSTYNMSVTIEFHATANTLIATLPENYSDTLDFSAFTGIPNNSAGGKTGDIVFTTNGAASGDTYMIILTLIKNYE
jgi:hypothetical protein